MIGFLVTTAAIFACGLAVSDRLWRDEELGIAERLTSAAIVGLSIWLAASWLLAVTHLLTQWTLIGVVVVMSLGSIVILSRADGEGSQTTVRRILRSFASLRMTVALLLPWLLFALWKGYVLPPETHDALAYHLPKAAMMAQAHGFEHFAAPDSRITSLPANYELLLADVLVMAGSDRLTEWIGTLSFLLFLCATAAMAERWWGGTAHRAATMLAVAGAPVLLLHSTADKNDLLTCAVAVTALLWGARWSASGGRMPMLLLILSIAIGVGTKPNDGAIFVALAPFLLLRWRKLTLRGVAATALVAVIAFLLLGGIAYIDIARHLAAPAGVKAGNAEAAGPFVWGDFRNLWQVPYLMLTVPFVQKPNAVWVPWRGEYWYWPHYEIFFSHWGALVTILAILAPLCAWAVREANRERRVATIAAAIAAALILPLHMEPIGMFAAMPRYVAFVLPVIACWSVPPLIELLRARSALIARTFVLAIAAFFAVSAIDCAVNDRFAPIQFVRWAARHPGTRAVFFMPNRAASVADRSAGPNDTIAIDAAFDTWSYPAFGAHLTRHVVFLPQPASPNDIPPAAQWVVIDRSWNRLWEHPSLSDMGKFWQYAGRGKPAPEDVHLLLALQNDPRFELVFYDPRLNQAVFRRR